MASQSAGDQQVIGPLTAKVSLGRYSLLGSLRLSSKSANSEVTSITKTKTGHQHGHYRFKTLPSPPALTGPIWGQDNLLRSQKVPSLTELTVAPMYPHPEVPLLSPGISHLQLLYSRKMRKMKGFWKESGEGRALRAGLLGGEALIWKGVRGSLREAWRALQTEQGAVLGARGAVFGTESEVVPQNLPSGGLGFRDSGQVPRF